MRTGGKPAVWPSDRVQVAAYGMLLEDAFGLSIDEGRVDSAAVMST
jgi:hypothetical protein